MKRLGVFLFYDADGIVGPHVIHLLREFSKHITNIVFVANGKLDPASAKEIAPFVTKTVVRENRGFDVWGYRDGLRNVGFSALAQYDEVILFNYTFFGPMFDLSEMFGEMAKKTVDFWGITEYKDKTRHFIQSYFIVTRKALHTSEEYFVYWNEMPEIKSIDDSLEFHEWRFSQYFLDRGFRMMPYVENALAWTGNTTLTDVAGLLEKRAPVIKYRAFNFEPGVIERRGGRAVAENFDLIAKKTEYPVNLIWNYIISQTDTDGLLENTENARLLTPVAALAAPSPSSATKREAAYWAFVSVEDSRYLDKMVAALAWMSPERITFVTTDDRIAARVKEKGLTTRVVKAPVGGMPVVACQDLIKARVKHDDVVLNLSCFEGERDVYFFYEHLIRHYWQSLCQDADTVAEIGSWLAEAPHIGVVFPPTGAVLGRQVQVEGLCPRASNWGFESYPADVAGAVGRYHWPWRGNAAFAGRLVRDNSFMARLAQLQRQARPSPANNVCGVEGVLLELARKHGYSPGLAVTPELAKRFVFRGPAEERDARKRYARHAQRSNAQLKQLRADLAKQVTEMAVAAPAKGEDVTSASVTAGGAGDDLSSDAVTAAHELLRRRSLPSALRAVVRFRASGDRFELERNGTDEEARPLSLFATNFATGRIDIVAVKNRSVESRGWCYDADNQINIVHVAVAQGEQILGEFSSCLVQRIGISAKLNMALPHEFCGFAIKVTVPPGLPVDANALQFLVVDDSLQKIIVLPLKIGSISPRRLEVKAGPPDRARGQPA